MRKIKIVVIFLLILLTHLVSYSFDRSSEFNSDNHLNEKSKWVASLIGSYNACLNKIANVKCQRGTLDLHSYCRFDYQIQIDDQVSNFEFNHEFFYNDSSQVPRALLGIISYGLMELPMQRLISRNYSESLEMARAKIDLLLKMQKCPDYSGPNFVSEVIDPDAGKVY